MPYPDDARLVLKLEKRLTRHHRILVLDQKGLHRALGIRLDLVEGIVSDDSLKSEIHELVRIKKAGSEADVGPRLPVIHEFLESELTGPNVDLPEPATRVSVDRINRLFREIVRSDAPST